MIQSWLVWMSHVTHIMARVETWHLMNESRHMWVCLGADLSGWSRKRWQGWCQCWYLRVLVSSLIHMRDVISWNALCVCVCVCVCVCLWLVHTRHASGSVCCSVLQCVADIAVRCVFGVYLHVVDPRALWKWSLQHTAAHSQNHHYNALEYTATNCNKLRRWHCAPQDMRCMSLCVTYP